MKAITTRILRAIIEICVSKHTSAIYFFKVGMTKIKCQITVKTKRILM
jgi:hypothetical protein